MAAEKRVDSKGRKLPDGYTQRPDGRYMARFTHNGQRYTLYDVELNKLKEKVNAKKYELKHDIFCKDSKMTLNEWYKKYVDVYYSRKVKPTTLASKDAMYQLHVRDTFGKMQLQKIKKTHVVEFYNSLSDKGLSSSSISFIHTYLNGMFKIAEDEGIIIKNPISGAMGHIDTDDKTQRIALTLREQTLFMDYLRNVPHWNVYEPIFAVLFNTGLRIGEATALTWDDIDFEKKTISVTKTLVVKKFYGDDEFKYHISKPKTKSSIRTIPMIPEVIEALQQQQEINKRYKLKTNIVIDGCQDFVFITQRGKPRERTGLNRVCQRVVKNINAMLEKENREYEPLRSFTAHTTRHTFATRAFEVGMTPKTVQTILGHSTLEMTMNIYTHVTEEKKLNEISLLSKEKGEVGE